MEKFRHLAISMFLTGLILTVLWEWLRPPARVPAIVGECAMAIAGEGRQTLQCDHELIELEKQIDGSGRIRKLSPSQSFTLGRSMDLESATLEELQLLPGIGFSRAQSIIEYRQRNGSMGAVENLLNIKGIGPRTLARLRPLLRPSGSDKDASSP